jgi:hypothetical protein
MWEVPEDVVACARNCFVRVNPDLVKQLREELGGLDGRAGAFQFVDDEFAATANDAFGSLGFPLISLSSAWDIFVAVDDILSLPSQT